MFISLKTKLIFFKGQDYTIRLRALNKNGPGPWSDEFQFTSGSTCPDAPDSLVITTKSFNCLLINWTEPECNGSPIIEYKLEWSVKENEQFTNLFTGNSLKYELKNLFLPNTKYLFRIQAINIIGPSQFSQIVEYITPASVPGIVTGIRLEEIHSDSALISWKQPNTNGSSIQFYHIDFNEQSSHSNPYIVVHQNECTFLFDSLQPDTNYKFRIQAANSVGIGQFSNMLKFKTKALAPLPPNLECVWVSYNGIKLKWNTNDNLNYILQYRKNEAKISAEINDDEEKFATIYEGSSNQFRLNKLSESTSYLFRICAINEAGQGKWSHSYNFSTARSPPIITKAPSFSEITSNGCLVQWNKSNLEKSDILEYCLQIQKKDGEFKEAYRGSDCFYRFKDLEANSEFSVRVCAAIQKDEITQQRICAPFSPIGTFTTLKSSKTKEKLNTVETKQNESISQNGWLDKILFPAFFSKLNGSSKKNSISKNLPSGNKAGKKSSFSKPSPSDLNTNIDPISTVQSRNDHFWAFLLIIFLVILSFLVAYCVSFYFDVATVRSVEF